MTIRIVHICICLVAAATLMATSLTHAATYYMAVDGNDANRGDIDHPFASIQQAQKQVGPYVAHGNSQTDSLPHTALRR